MTLTVRTADGSLVSDTAVQPLPQPWSWSYQTAYVEGVSYSIRVVVAPVLERAGGVTGVNGADPYELTSTAGFTAAMIDDFFYNTSAVTVPATTIVSAVNSGTQIILGDTIFSLADNYEIYDRQSLGGDHHGPRRGRRADVQRHPDQWTAGLLRGSLEPQEAVTSTGLRTPSFSRPPARQSPRPSQRRRQAGMTFLL